MISLQSLAAHLRSGIQLARLAAAEPLEVLQELFRADEARRMHELGQVYFGRCGFSRRQAEAVRAAGANGLSLDDLMLIERYARRMRTQRERWELRERLCSVPGHRIAEAARRPQAARRPGVRQLHGKSGVDTLIYTGASAVVTRLRDQIAGPDADREVTALLDAAAGRPGQRPPVALPHVVITLDQMAKVREGAEDVTVRLTNGAVVTGAELVRMQLHDVGYATLIHPVHGPVNLYRTRRHASVKQRLMASAEQPVCAWPGCRQGASRCEVHHLKAWKHGGMSNPENLTMLCRYHNGVNGDGSSPRGRIARVDGKVTWVPPD